MKSRRRGEWTQRVADFCFAGSAVFTLLLLVGIFILLGTVGWGALRKIPLADFLGVNWNPTSYVKPAWGIISLLLGTLLVSGVALMVSLPMGLAIAIYLSEIETSRFKEVIKPLIEMIASIPSVVLGLLGLLYLAPIISSLFHISNGLNSLTAGLLVGVAALPTVASMSQDALESVPRSLREAGLALGSTRWQTIWKVVLPAALPGIVAAFMLGAGRVIGETMIVLMVGGNVRALPHSLLSPVSPVTATIATDIQEVVVGSLHWQTLFALGFLLFLMTFVLNFAADLLIRKKT